MISTHLVKFIENCLDSWGITIIPQSVINEKDMYLCIMCVCRPQHLMETGTLHNEGPIEVLAT